MSETKKRNMRTRKEKTVARKAIAPKAEETTAGIAVAASDGITTGISNRSAVGATAGITTGVSNGSAVGASDGGITTGVSNGSAVGISDGIVADITADMSVGVSNGISGGISTSASEGLSEGTSTGVSATIGAGVTSAIPAGASASVNSFGGKDLKELTAEWMQLERKTLEQRKDAARFYDEHLMKPIEAEFVRNNQDMVFEDVEYMVISVGTSYEPIVLDIQLLKPAKILFLYTEASQDTMAKVIGYCGLSPTRYDKSLVSEVDPMDTYREIKSFYLRSGKPGKMYIDFTGGTKAMSAAATLAGAMIDVQMVYCSTDDYLVDFRKPNPGSERLIYIENPLAVFGELEIEKAFELFDKKNFAGAKEKFSVLKENLPDPALRQQLGFVCLLATAYEAWDALDFVPAYESMQRLQKEIERDRKLHRDYLLMDYSMHIDRQRALHMLMQNGVDVSYFTRSGKYIGATAAESAKNIFLRFEQYKCFMDESRRMDIARTIVDGKIRNQMEMISRHAWTGSDYDWRKDIKSMEQNRLTIPERKDSQELMGIEGVCSQIYFGAFGRMLTCDFRDDAHVFRGRNRRPPKDPVNVILSLAYTFLTREVCGMLEAESFEPYLGFLHGIRYGRKSLSLDLVEEFRQPVVDRLVLTLFNKHMISMYDFEDEEEGRVTLAEEGYRKFCLEYERWMSGRVSTSSEIPFRTAIKNQIAAFRQTIQFGEPYVPYAWSSTKA